MTNRKAEFLNIIKPILDRSQVEKDADDLAVELQDRLGKVKVGLDERGLKEFEEVFNKEMVALGKQPIVLSNISIGDNTIRDMAKQIARGIVGAVGNAISNGIKNSVNDALSTIAELEKAKAPKVSRRQELKKKLVGFESLNTVRSSSKDIHPHPLAKEGDINKQARKIYEEFEVAKKSLEGLDSVYDDAEYNKILDSFYDAVNNMYRMRQTIKNYMDEFTDDELYEKFQWKNLNKSVDKAFQIGETSLNEYISNRSKDYKAEMHDLGVELSNIDNQINEIKNSNPEIIKKDAVEKSLKSLEEVEKAYDRIRNKTKKKEVNKNKLDAIVSTVDYDPAAENNKNILATLSKGLSTARQNGASWEEEYQWIVKFVKQYKYLQENGKLSEHLQKQYGPLFNELVDMADNAETSLRTLIDRAEGKIQPSKVVDNKEKLSEENKSLDVAERKVQAQSDAADAAEREEKATKETLKIEEKMSQENETPWFLDLSKYKKVSEELEKQNKILLRRVEGKFNPDLVGSENSDSIIDIKNTLSYGFGGFGDGLFGATKTGAETLLAEGDVSFFEFDASKYNTYINNTVEEAEKLRNFLWNLQRIIGDGTPFEFDDTTLAKLKEDGINLMDEGQLYERFKELFNDSNMTKEEFLAWIKNAQKESLQIHSDLKKGIAPSNLHNFGTRFMQSMGYEGIVNDIKDDPDYSGNYQGSVIFEPDTKEINDYIKKTGRVFYNNEDFMRHLGLQDLIERIGQSGKEPVDFFDDILKDASLVDEELKQILATLGLIDSQGNLHLQSIHDGFTNLGGIVTDTYTLIARKGEYLPKTGDLMPKLAEAKAMGANVGDILGVYKDEANNVIYELQRTVSGKSIAESNDFLEATDEQVLKLIEDLKILKKAGLQIDFGGDNIFYDKEKGFSFIDLATKPQYGQETADGMMDRFKSYIGGAKKDDRFDGFINRLNNGFNVGSKDTKLDFAPYELNIKDAEKIVGEKVDKKILQDWYVNQNHAARDILTKQILEDNDLRNAALNIAWDNYKKYGETDISFDNFLKKDMDMYRGEKTAKFFHLNDATSFTPFKQAAEQFGEDIVKTTMKPIETLGSLLGSRENELFVQRSNVENKPEIKEWLGKLSDRDEKEFDSRVNEIKRLLQQNRTEDDILDSMKRAGWDNTDKILVKAKEELAIQEQLNAAKEEEQRIEQQPDAVVVDNQKKIESYEELKQVLQEYYDTSSKIKRIEWNEKDEKWLGIEGVRFPDGASGEPEKYFKQQWKRVSLIRKSIKDGADSYIDPELKTAVRIQENTLEKEMQELEAYATQFVLNVEGFSDAQKKFVNEINQKYDKWIQQNDLRYAELDKYNKPYEDKAHEIDSLIGKQLKDPNDMKSYSTFMRALSNVKQYGVTEQSLKIISNLIGVEVPQAAETAKQAVDGLSASLAKQQQIEHTDSSQAKVAEEKAETTAIEQQNEALKENINLKQMVENATKHGVPGQSVADAAGITSGGDAGASIGMQELQNVLSAITYKVKIINDDADKTANKIALDDSSLEATLNRVFANILNPVTEQNDGNVQEPWAREDTLGTTIKGVLNSIQTNTSKIGTTEVATVADDGVLAAIKTAVESINKKIVQGTKVIKTGDRKKTEEKSYKPEIKNPKELGNVKATKVDTRVKAIQGLYEQRGRLLAQNSFESSNETQEEINQLNKLIQLKFKELGLEDDKKKVLKQSLMVRQEEAKQSEVALLIAKQADNARKKAAKDEKADLRARLKRSKEENRFGASTTAWNSGNKALESLWKIDAKDKPLEQKSVQDLMASLKELNTVRQRVNENLRKGIEISNEDSEALSNRTKEVAMHTEAVKQLVKNYDDLSGDNAKETGYVFGGGDLETHLKNVAREVTNGKARIGDFDAATGRLKYTVQTGTYEFKEYEMAVREAGGATVALQKGTKRTETFFESFKRKLGELTRYFSASSLIYKFFNEIRKGIQYIREIDAALVELRKVTDKTDEEYDEFLNNASKTADRLGSTISAVTEATATFAKLGYSMEMATEMAESAIVYKNVGDGIASTEDAADSIISTLKGFRLEASESMKIVDRFNEVGNKFAITSQGIGEALRVSASALSAAGNTLDESIGIITAANEVVNDPSSVGTALKTLTLRLRGAKTELEEMGEDVSDMATTTSQLQAKLLALTGGQVDIMLDENTFKSSTQILREMSAAWETMTDVQQAAALELMGGKRQANVLSALISNFDTAEKAIEASANSAGSALRENRVYLDSIQGRIDKFTTAVQSMWKNTLDSDVVKWFVDLGTAIVKVIDKLGLIPSLLIAISTYSMIKHRMGPLAFFTELSNALRKTPGKIKDFAKSFTSIPTAASKAAKAIENLSVSVGSFQESMAGAGLDAKQQKSVLSQLGLDGTNSDFKLNNKQINADNLAGLANNGTLNKTQVDQLASVYGLKDAYKELSAEQMNNVLTNMKLDESQKQNIINTLGLNDGSKLLTQNNIEQAFASNGLATADGTLAAANVGLTTTNTGLAASFKALWTAMWPILALMAGIAAIYGVVKLFDAMITTSAELEDKLSDLQSEMSDLESEIDSINSELETTQERMEELLAMPSLSFAEEEELRTLQAQNAELERQLELKEDLKEAKQNEITSTAENWIDEAWNDGSNFDVKSDHIDDDTDKSANGAGATEVINDAIDKYKSATGDDKKEFEQGINNMLGHYADKISEYNLVYGMSDEIDAYLDEYYALFYKWQKAQGKLNTSDILGKILSDETNEGISTLKEKMSDIMDDDSLTDAEKQAKAQKIVQDAMNDTSGTYDRLKTSMDTVGISADQLARYFTQMSKAPDSSTIEGITAQYAKGVEALGKYSGNANDIISTFTDLDGNVEQITWGSLFDEDGKIIDTQISKVLQGADETTRKEFARLAKSVYDGKITVEQAMNSFGAAGVVASWKLVEAQVSELNADVFKDLGDEISGVINTVSELSSAFESVADSIDLVNQAQAEMAYSGHLSVETALQLMESTDDWSKVLKIEEGNIKLVDGAEEALVQTKLDLIKTNLQTTLSTLKAQLAQLTATETNMDAATTIEESTNVAVRELAANMAYSAKMAEAYTRAMNGENINIDSYMQAAEEAKQNVLDKTNYTKNAAKATGREEIEKQIADTEAMLSMLDTVDTPSEFKSNYSSDDVSGGSGTKEDAEKSLVENMLDEYERRLALITNERDLIEAEIDKMEAQGGKASAQYYEDLIRNSNEEKSLLQEKKKYLEDYLAANKNSIDSETWAEYNDELNETAIAIKECETNTIEWAEALREIDMHYFEQVIEEFTQLGEEIEFINGLLEDEEVADENGNWSNAALTRMGLYTQQLELSAAKAQEYQEKIDKLNEQYKNGEIAEEKYREDLANLVDGQRDAIQSYEDAKDSIVELNEARIDAIRDGIDKEIEAYEDLIDLKKSELEAERD